MIEVKNLEYLYGPGTAFETKALDNINLTINDGEFIAIIGHTGSGKSTLIQHLNGLLKAHSGEILYNGKNIYDEDYDLTAHRCKVGLVFQYPEYQLFETDVLTDVGFGPKNQGLSKEEIEKVSIKALEDVGMDEKYYKKSPFMLSGGQKKRAAIAGILAMNPEVLILDEPTAGLDPKGRDKILKKVSELHKERGITVIWVSHSMDDVAKYAERIVVMNEGKVAYDGEPKEVFKNYIELEKMGLSAPQVTYVLNDLKNKGFDVDDSLIDVEEVADEIYKCLS
ncbi:energy-coupling factor transporter ATPase [Eubacterium sp.]|uniref:energy-coupling factor transporter ATPase n=1 Tax=Eubacterium sp. TaxID=142586 RepID=UPI0025EAA66F|nr:energy-coupling factor transporter ATPase [Eubacterium sp.]MCR5628929.1 energy-coupling factor transporter ATPase [Eubacterium sp.]